MTNSAERVVKIRSVAEALGSSPATVHRILKLDPAFPTPFRLTPKGELRWIESDVLAYRDRKAGRRTATYPHAA
jgi:predicted DNA-binding transcriptional regulator AlpA